jgi:hypothetical protein
MHYIAVLAFAVAAAAQPLEYTILKEGVLQERLKLANTKNSVRYSRLKTLFEDSGCRGDLYREQIVKGSREPNMICTGAGTEPHARRIIVGAHFDSVGGDGIIDNWSGAVLLPSLAAALRNKPRRHTFEFVAFAAEEKGLLGSRSYLKSIPKDERKDIAAVLTMDSIGLTSTKCWTNGSSRELITAGIVVAKALGLEFSGVNVDQVGTTDSQLFKDAHIPVLSLHSVTQETWRLINSPKDVWSIVSWKDYYDTHRFVSALLVYLDRELP